MSDGRPQPAPEESPEVDKAEVHLEGDPMSDIREAFLAQYFEAEEAGSDRSGVASIGARGGTASGVPENLPPLLNSPQAKHSLRDLADEAETQVKNHPTWKAGAPC